MTKVFYLDRKDAIRAAIVKRAKQRATMTYTELGAEVGIPPTGPWKGVLDHLAREEVAAGRHDLTYLVVSKTTGLPSQIGFVPSKKPTAQQREQALAEFGKIWDQYADDTSSPRPA